MKQIFIFILFISSASFAQTKRVMYYDVNGQIRNDGTYIDSARLKTNLTDSIGFGTSADARLTVSNVICSTCPTPQTGTLVHTVSEGTVNGRTSMDSYNNGGSQGSILQGRRGRGTANLPTYALKDDILLAIGADGYGSTGFHNVSLGGLSVRAATDFSTQTSAPVYLVFTTTDSNSIVPVQRAYLNQKGMWQWTSYGAGVIQSDAAGNLTSAALTNSQITAALGYTPTQANTYSQTTKTSAYTITANDYYIDCNGAFPITLLSAVGIGGKTFVITNIGNGTITLTANSGETIMGLSTYPIPSGNSITVHSDNVSSFIIN